MDQELLNILVCPETKEALFPADSSVIEDINKKIEQGILKNRGNKNVNAPIDEGLIRSDKKYLYPIREEIPIMLIEEAIPLQ